MIIRSAQLADLPDLLPMIAKICALHQAWDDAKYGFLPEPQQHYSAWLKRLIQDERNLCLVAEDEAKRLAQTTEKSRCLAGFLIASVETEIPIYCLKEFAFIHDLWVEEAYRQSGMARQMVKQTIAHFRKLGIEQVRLDTVNVNQAARNLFTTCGFRISTIEMLIELNTLE